MVTLQSPKFDFQESAQMTAAASGRPAGTRLEIDGVHRFVSARFVEHLKQPYFSTRLNAYLSDTDTPALKVLTRGSVPYDQIRAFN